MFLCGQIIADWNLETNLVLQTLVIRLVIIQLTAFVLLVLNLEVSSSSYLETFKFENNEIGAGWWMFVRMVVKTPLIDLGDHFVLGY